MSGGRVELSWGSVPAGSRPSTTPTASRSGRAERMGSDLDDLRERGLAGTPTEIVDRLAAYGPDGAGASRVYLQILDLADLGHLALTAEEILPDV